MKFLSWISDCNSTHFTWKSACNVFMLTDNGVANITKSWFFFCNLETYSQISVSERKKAAYSLFRALHLANVINMQIIFCHHLRVSTAPSPCTGFSPDNAITHWCWVVAELWVHAWGWARLLKGEKPPSWWHKARRELQYGLFWAESSLQVGHACHRIRSSTWWMNRRQWM